MIFAVSSQIQQIFFNLILNSLDAMPGGGDMKISARELDHGIEMIFQDNGPGIPLSEQERIFGKFTRLKGVNTTSGLGMGLAFCRLAVSGHGGRIWVENKRQ